MAKLAKALVIITATGSNPAGGKKISFAEERKLMGIKMLMLLTEINFKGHSLFHEKKKCISIHNFQSHKRGLMRCS